MYSKNIIVRRNVKYRTVRIMEQVGRFIDLLAEKRIGIIRKGAFTRKRKLSYQSVFLTILDVGALSYEYGNQKCVLLGQNPGNFWRSRCVVLPRREW